MPAAAVFVFPSLYEGFGFPPLEAMASGVPVIVSDRASLPEIVDDAGELMNPEDPVETSERLRSMLEDPAHRRELAWRGIAQAGAIYVGRPARRTPSRVTGLPSSARLLCARSRMSFGALLPNDLTQGHPRSDARYANPTFRG